MFIGNFYLPLPPGVGELTTLTIEGVLRFVVELILILGVVLAVIFLLLGAIQWITSGGNKEGLDKARKRITFSIIGLIVILLAFFIINFLGIILGVRLITPKFPTPVPRVHNTL